ncbi:MAG TPA: 50S ribosomal protein L15 [Halanaerobiales bacterium]|nr:50S ribosomal protein L15 [Halanaerobiales bacterium]
MNLHDLKPAKGSKTRKRRVGRGEGSGRGYTSGRGANGQNSRSGSKTRPTFEGGQTPLFRKLPKRGFNNKFKKQFSIINVYQLNRYEDGTEITPELLKNDGLIDNIAKHGVKILAKGDLSKEVVVKANAFSSSAVDKIEKVGGKAEVI